jgi:imidazole glycerol-phosphate synthase subunit HisH
LLAARQAGCPEPFVKIAIVDYGMGNLRSVEKALHKLGHAAAVTGDPAAVLAAERVILPGVGAFGAGMRHLSAPREGGSLAEAVRSAAMRGTPVLGICLGMQLLLTESEEQGRFAGLNLVPGRVVRLEAPADQPRLKIPHMGWNALRFPRPSPLFAGIEEGAQVYFVHGYQCRPEDPAVVAATSEHGREFCAALTCENLFATQFHPEKSGAVGLRLLDNFARL